MATVFDVRGSWVQLESPLQYPQHITGLRSECSYLFDGGRISGQARDFVFQTVIPSLKAACPGKKVFITESGWPSRGPNNNVAVASVTDERNAIFNLNCACRDDTSVSVFACEYDDQAWKANDNERSFGIFDKITLNGDAFAPC